MAEEKITMENLALMIGKGFSGVDEKFEDVKKEMSAGFKAVNERLDKLQNDRIEKLEGRMQKLEEALAIK